MLVKEHSPRLSNYIEERTMKVLCQDNRVFDGLSYFPFRSNFIKQLKLQIHFQLATLCFDNKILTNRKNGEKTE